MLVAPTDRHALLVEESRIADPDGATLRNDLFLAFTRISEHGFQYLRSQDRFEQRFFDSPAADGNAVLVSPMTMEQSIKDRQEFCGEIQGQDQELAESLRQALRDKDHTALRLFGDKVRESRLQARWHRFRIRLLVQRIRSWAGEAGIDWQATWWGTHNAESGHHEGPPDFSSQLSPTLLEAMASLRPIDLARISIPLDIVARLFNHRLR
ncbi:MAG: hypothetical protein HQL66_10695 [Magnetococcales bacterium]|nr:hypothetical protein [Magnetococcales bacterium]